jgi:hypothetical protein
MKIGIMQPYLFPYLGYFQLINAVDLFVSYDDVQYIKNGWINRNRILLNNREVLFSFSVKKDESTKFINQRYYSEELFEKEKNHFLATVRLAYRKRAPNFSEAHEILSKIFDFDNFNVAEFNINSIKILCDYMDIRTKIIASSTLKKTNGLKSQDRVIEINKILGAKCYINPIGGMELYTYEIFKENGITLKFIKMNDIKYSQLGVIFVPSLSIIDFLMNNSKNEINNLLGQYTLV